MPGELVRGQRAPGLTREGVPHCERLTGVGSVYSLRLRVRFVLGSVAAHAVAFVGLVWLAGSAVGPTREVIELELAPPPAPALASAAPDPLAAPPRERPRRIRAIRR